MFFLSFLLFCPKELSSFSCLSSMIDCCYHLLLPIYPQNFFPFHFLFLIKLLEFSATAAAAKSLQLCPTLCDPRDSSPPGSAIPGILQARTLEWVAISFSNAWKWKVKVKSLSRVRLFATPWTVAYQAPPSMGFSRQVSYCKVNLAYLFVFLFYILRNASGFV